MFASSAAAEKRVALVIGNAAYAHADRLANPEADAAAMAALFTRLGFETQQAKTNLSLSAMKRALADFELAAKGADIAVIYYSGHGVQIGGQDYLVPIDAELAREVDVPDETVPLERALRAISGASRLRLMIVDACRDNPFNAWSGHKGLTRGLAPPPDVSGLASTLIAFAASPGEQAVDGPSGGNSPFASSLLKRLPTPGLDIELALRLVTRDVYEATQGRQTPYKAGSLIGQTLPLVEGSAPEPGADLSDLAVAQLCAVAFDAAHGDWDARPALRTFVEEAKRRGVSPGDCKAAAPTASPTSTPPNELSDLPASVLCRDALDDFRGGWDTRPAFAAKVEEARRRGLDVVNCRVTLGLSGEPPTTSPDDLEKAPPRELCRKALNANLDGWDDEFWRAEVDEAKRRGLDIAACVRAIGAESASAPPKPAATPNAGGQTLVAAFQSWNVYTQRFGAGKLCFALTLPTSREGADSPAYLFISDRPGDRAFNEVSVIVGVEVVADSPVASIDGVDYAMIARAGHLWVRNVHAERAFVAAMRAGSTLTIKATTRKGVALADAYSLAGVSQAIDRAAAECPK